MLQAVIDKLPKIETPQHDPIEAVEGIIAGMPKPPKIVRGGAKAFYSPATASRFSVFIGAFTCFGCHAPDFDCDVQKTRTLSASWVQVVSSSIELRLAPCTSDSALIPRASMHVPHTPIRDPFAASPLSIRSRL